jgi:hypothetical protein
MLVNVHPITEDSPLVASSATGCELTPYASNASEVILWVDKRLHQTSILYTSASVTMPYPEMTPCFGKRIRGIFVGKILAIERMSVSNRMTVIIFREPRGI